MANLTITITIEDDVLRRAQAKALEEGKSVETVLTEFLTAYAGEDEERQMERQREAVEQFLALAEEHSAEVGPVPPSPRTWRREDLYDRKVLRDRRDDPS